MVNEFEEFRKQYEKTFVRVSFENTDELHIVKVAQCIADDERKPYIVLQNPKLGSLVIAWNNTKQTFNYEFPKVGLFNFGESFLMFHRFPDRQWKRGISEGNSHIADPFRDIKFPIPELRNTLTKSISISYPVLSALYAENYPLSLDEAIDNFQSPSITGLALDQTFGISLSPRQEESYILWKHLGMIGTIDERRGTIHVEEETFTQEVGDFLKRTNQQKWMLI